MKRKILIGLIGVVGVVLSVINHWILGIMGIGVWIYLVRMVWKQNNRALNSQSELKKFPRHLKWIKALLIVGGFLFLIFIVGAIVHNVLYGLSKIEESVFIVIALISLIAFVLATAGALGIFLKGREKLR